jgi:hypothetical protein
MTHEKHMHINPEVYERLILDATICCKTSARSCSFAHLAIQLNHIHNRLAYLSTVTETGWKHVRPVFNKRELLRLYVWGNLAPFPNQVMCIWRRRWHFRLLLWRRETFVCFHP